MEVLGSAEPLRAAKTFTQLFTGSSREAQALRESGIFEEIATALTQTRGTKARNALKLVERAMSGQRLTDQQAAFVGSTVANSAFLGGSHEASQRLSN